MLKLLLRVDGTLGVGKTFEKKKLMLKLEERMHNTRKNKKGDGDQISSS